ncbi:alanine--tRNA ligase, partial [Candidatus Sumerlaeota bacterium]|nr:alanine--tRNA ligase [Candidatus Sumerlaeota bacterium]
VLAILKNGQRVENASEGDEITLILEETCFYGEAGGQVGDTGTIRVAEEDRKSQVLITDTRKTPSGIILHQGKVISGEIRSGDIVEAEIDGNRRLAIMRNHTTTHLLQKALKMVVGRHITQQGSSVMPEAFRFDFTNPEPVTREQILEVERIVQGEILKDISVVTRELPLEEAMRLGAIAPFGEKYGAVVRVVSVGDFSMEFCGGTHVKSAGQIGGMVIMGESSIASGIRRIEAKTGMGAFEENQKARSLVAELCRSFSTTPEEISSRMEKMADEMKDMKKEMQKLRQEKAAGSSGDVLDSVKEISGIKVLIRQTEGVNASELRNVADTLGAKLKDGVVFIGNAEGEKVSLVCKVVGAALGKVSAVKIVKEAAKIVGGGGGGRDDMAQAGGRFPDKIGEALASAESLIGGQTL